MLLNCRNILCKMLHNLEIEFLDKKLLFFDFFYLLLVFLLKFELESGSEKKLMLELMRNLQMRPKMKEFYQTQSKLF